MKDLPRRAAPRRSAILADVISRAEHATAKCRLPRCDSTLLFITPFPDSLPRLSSVRCPLPSLSSTAERRSLFSLFFLFPRRVRTACVQTFAFRLRNEARHPTLDTCKMAEFNRKALFAARSWRGGRGGPPILITLISIPFLWRLCGGEGVASIDSP